MYNIAQDKDKKYRRNGGRYDTVSLADLKMV